MEKNCSSAKKLYSMWIRCSLQREGKKASTQRNMRCCCISNFMPLNSTPRKSHSCYFSYGFKSASPFRFSLLQRRMIFWSYSCCRERTHTHTQTIESIFFCIRALTSQWRANCVCCQSLCAKWNPRYFKPSDWKITKNEFPSHLRRRRRFSISNEIQSVWCHGFGLGLFYGSIDSNFERTQRICTSVQTYSMNMLWVIMLSSHTHNTWNSIATDAPPPPPPPLQQSRRASVYGSAIVSRPVQRQQRKYYS